MTKRVDKVDGMVLTSQTHNRGFQREGSELAADNGGIESQSGVAVERGWGGRFLLSK